MTTSRLVAVLVGYGLFLVNPNLGCASADDAFEFGAAEMKAASEGTWSFTPEGAPSPQVTFTLHYGTATAQSRDRAFVRPAAACGSRSFVASAAACVTVSNMHLDGQITAGQGALASGAVNADFAVYGTRFDGGVLSVKFADGDHLEAQPLPNAPTIASWFSGSGAILGFGRLQRATP